MNETKTRSFSLWALVAVAGCAALVASFFLPWLALGSAEREDLGVSQGDLRALEEAARSQGKDTEAVVALVRRIRDGDPATGREWHQLLGWSLEHAEARRNLEPREVRAFRAAHTALAALPLVAALLAVLLLLDRLRTMRASVIAVLFVLGLVLGGLGGLLWLGASVQAKEHATQTIALLGFGLKLLATGGLACLIAALFGITRDTWLRAWALGILLSTALVVGTVLYVRG